MASPYPWKKKIQKLIVRNHIIGHFYQGREEKEYNYLEKKKVSSGKRKS